MPNISFSRYSLIYGESCLLALLVVFLPLYYWPNFKATESKHFFSTTKYRRRFVDVVNSMFNWRLVYLSALALLFVTQFSYAILLSTYGIVIQKDMMVYLNLRNENELAYKALYYSPILYRYGMVLMTFLGLLKRVKYDEWAIYDQWHVFSIDFRSQARIMLCCLLTIVPDILFCWTEMMRMVNMLRSARASWLGPFAWDVQYINFAILLSATLITITGALLRYKPLLNILYSLICISRHMRLLNSQLYLSYYQKNPDRQVGGGGGTGHAMHTDSVISPMLVVLDDLMMNDQQQQQQHKAMGRVVANGPVGGERKKELPIISFNYGRVPPGNKGSESFVSSQRLSLGAPMRSPIARNPFRRPAPVTAATTATAMIDETTFDGSGADKCFLSGSKSPVFFTNGPQQQLQQQNVISDTSLLADWKQQHLTSTRRQVQAGQQRFGSSPLLVGAATTKGAVDSGMKQQPTDESDLFGDQGGRREDSKALVAVAAQTDRRHQRDQEAPLCQIRNVFELERHLTQIYLLTTSIDRHSPAAMFTVTLFNVLSFFYAFLLVRVTPSSGYFEAILLLNSRILPIIIVFFIGHKLELECKRLTSLIEIIYLQNSSQSLLYKQMKDSQHSLSRLFKLLSMIKFDVNGLMEINFSTLRRLVLYIVSAIFIVIQYDSLLTLEDSPTLGRGTDSSAKVT